MTDMVCERIAKALESIARDVKRFVEACERNERQAAESYAPPEGESRVILEMLKGDAP